MSNFFCEICGGREFFEFNYPTGGRIFHSKIIRGEIRRYFANLAKFLLRIILIFTFGSRKLENLKVRAKHPYSKMKSPLGIARAIGNLDRGLEMFRGKKIAVCKKCDIGTVFPKISESQLTDYYRSDYWVADSKELENCENNRTTSTYKILDEATGFKNINVVLEFGSASAQLSRYIKSRRPGLVFDCVDPGIVWKDLLKPFIRNIYSDIAEIEGKYDLICGSHSLEHVPDINRYFKIFLNLLNRGGYLYFEVPNSVEREIIFNNDREIHFPHTYFFTEKAFAGIAEKFGLKVIFTKTFSRSYEQRFGETAEEIDSTQENPNGAYLRVLLRKN